MRIFRFPPEASAEKGAFSLLSQDQQAELMLVPKGAAPDVAFEGPVFYLDQELDLAALPIGPETLVPESLGRRFPENPVCVSSCLTQGTLEDRLDQALDTWGPRLWLVVEPYCHLYPLPCPDGAGGPISRTKSAIFRSENESAYTSAFCCSYCTLLRRQGLLHLYDTEQTIEKKLELAERLGVENSLILGMEKAL